MVALVAVFEDRPPVPPSLAQAALLKQQQHSASSNGTVAANGEEGGAGAASAGKAHKGHYLHTIKLLLTNPSYVLLLLSYGFNVGTFYAVSTLLNQIILDQFPLSQFPVSCCGFYPSRNSHFFPPSEPW